MSPTETLQKVSTGWQSLRTGIITPFGSGGGGGGGGANWALFADYDLTTNLGWTIKPGNRALDSSINRAQQATWSGSGFQIKAERADTGATTPIYSADAEALFTFIPNWFALEADVKFGTYIGSGCFPALWLRPNGGGQGEIDVWEIMGGQQANSSRYKGTMILTNSPTTYNVAQKAVQFDGLGATYPPPLNTTVTYRVEKVPGKISFFINGVARGVITKAQMDAQPSSGGQTWNNNFEISTQKWYPRWTYQFGPPTDGRAFNPAGAVPGSWLHSEILLTRLVAYTYTGP